MTDVINKASVMAMMALPNAHIDLCRPGPVGRRIIHHGEGPSNDLPEVRRKKMVQITISYSNSSSELSHCMKLIYQGPSSNQRPAAVHPVPLTDPGRGGPPVGHHSQCLPSPEAFDEVSSAADLAIARDW
ncbi:MAG TPA: hypothetical protein VF463_03690 [Sphingobium sp.]